MKKQEISFDIRHLLKKCTENWPAKVLSVALAVVIFAFHRLSSLEERFLSVPLVVETPDNMIPASSYSRVIRLRLRGNGSEISHILEDDIEAYLDLKSHTAVGIFKTPVQIRKKGTALDVEPLEVTPIPGEVTLELDHQAGKLVPIFTVTQGTVAHGYELVSFTLTPNQVQIYGPTKVLSAISSLSTDAVDLDGRNEDFITTLDILNVNPFVVFQRDGTTEFRGIIREVIVQKQLDLAVVMRGLADELSITSNQPAVVRLYVEGTQNAMEVWIPPPDLVLIDLSSIRQSGTYTLPITVSRTIEPLTIQRIEPEQLSLSFQRIPAPPVAEEENQEPEEEL
ncbi:MAG: hypothetical protein LBQ77_08170 [Treponema sp.]|nr:hypothetical protein [Treponema sp.]